MKNLLGYIAGFVWVIAFSLVVSMILETPFLPTAAVVTTIATLQHLYFGAQQTGVLSMALLGFVKGCTERSGGATALYLAEVKDVTAFTLGATVDAKKWATVAMKTGTFFKKYEFEKNTVEFKESTARENGSTKVTKTIEFMLPKMSQESRDTVEEIMIASNCGLVAIVEDNNSQKWVVGYTVKHKKDKPLELQTSEATTGKAITDANGDTVILIAEDTERSRTFTGTVPLDTEV